MLLNLVYIEFNGLLPVFWVVGGLKDIVVRMHEIFKLILK